MVALPTPFSHTLGTARRSALLRGRQGIHLPERKQASINRNLFHITRELGYSYGWVDTCCSVKRASADLSDSITPIYRYYAEASICLIHLSDLRLGPSWNHLSTTQLVIPLKACR
jgi:hypothetical protein